MNIFRFAASSLLVAFAMAGCASPDYHGPTGSAPAYPVPVHSYPAQAQHPQTYMVGTVESIQIRQEAAPVGIGTGAVVGGVVGGLIGNQVGGGRGRKLATAAGVVGGAVVGHQMEQRNAQARDSYQVGVRLDNGAYRTVVQDGIAGLRIGSRVRIENERVYSY